MLLYFVLNGKLVNSETFESLNIKYWPCQARKRETIMERFERNGKYKECKNILSIAWHHNILTEMFTNT